MTYFNMGRVGCELRYLYVILSDSLYLTSFQTTKYVIKAICLYVILAKLSSFCLEEVLLYILKAI